MATTPALKILHEVCSLPTAPFAEQHVEAYVRQFAAKRNIRVSRDPSGNLLMEIRGTNKTRRPRWLFTAHMDHPGFVALRMTDRRTLEADFRGWVFIPYVMGAKVRFFSAGREVTGVVTHAAGDKETARARHATVRVSGEVAPGSPGMFDLGEGRIKAGKFYSRAVDDLGGVSAALAMLDAIAKKPAPSPVGVFLTRAEEAPFIGAIAACLRPGILRKTDLLVTIETSAEQPYAQQGDGAIIRIGDKSSVFNSSLSFFLTHQAEQLRKKDRKFKFQRALMPGGTCEATIFDIYGYTAAAACVPLRNYHNMDTARKKVGPEHIDVSDWNNMVKLFIHLARTGHEYEPGHAMLKRQMEERFAEWKHLL